MHTMPRRFLTASVLLGSLLSIQANAGEDTKNAPAGNQAGNAAVSASVSKGDAATTTAASQQNVKAPAQNAAAPATKPAPAEVKPVPEAAKPTVSENKPAATNSAARAPAAEPKALAPAAPAKPAEAVAPSAPTQALAAVTAQQSEAVPEPTVSHLAPGTHELRSLSIIEIIVSLALSGMLFLVLLRGNLFKGHH